MQKTKQTVGSNNCEIWHCGELASQIKEEAKAIAAAAGAPNKTLHIITVGSDPASAVYVRGKMKDCEECGFSPVHSLLGADATTQDVIDVIEASDADGIIVQLPLPEHINKNAVTDAIPAAKDVDGFLPENLGKMMIGRHDVLLPCTPAGIMRLLTYKKVDLAGTHVVVIGRSDIVGKPLAMMLINAGATVTCCNSKTRDLASHTHEADIVVSAAGCPGLLTKDMLKIGSIVVDVSINRSEDGTICGDASDDVADVAAAVTPVPGGIGLLTRAMLMENLAKTPC